MSFKNVSVWKISSILEATFRKKHVYICFHDVCEAIAIRIM